MRIFLILLFFIILGTLLIISNNDLKMNNQEDIDKFLNISSSWGNKIYSNMQTLTGQAVKLDWLPQ